MYSNSTRSRRLTLKPVNPEVSGPGSASLTKAVFFLPPRETFPTSSPQRQAPYVLKYFLPACFSRSRFLPR